ncbi:MAG: hypothetical protein D6690_05485, partial [Nitrospirae bacterium]
VTYLFDPQLAQKTEQIDACGLPHTIEVGKIVTETFLDATAGRVARVASMQGQPSAVPAGLSSDLLIYLTLTRFSLTPITRTGDEDRYHAEIQLQLQAVYRDAQGNALAQTPLDFHDHVSIWAPELSSQSVSCATGQFDGVVESAAESLAEQLLSLVPTLLGQPGAQPPATVRTPEAPAIQPAAQPSGSPQAPVLAFRTKLEDGNGNLILEGGEALVLHVEITNQGSIPVSTAFLELSGNPVLVQAFTETTRFPVQVGPLLPGESQSLEIRGLLPREVATQQAELLVTLKPAEGRAPGPHKILASLQPAPGSSGNTDRPIVSDSTASPSIQRSGTASESTPPYYAIIVALDRYRDPWPNAYTIETQRVEALADTLQATGMFPRSHIRILRGKHATRTDIEEAVLRLAKIRPDNQAVLLFYFAGHAVADNRGEVFLVPYEGGIRASKSRLISLRRLQQVLGRLPMRVSLLLLDTPVVQALGSGHAIGLNGHSQLKWHAALLQAVANRPTRVIQIRALPQSAPRNPDHLLSGLLGPADRNRDGQVTIGEFLNDLQGSAEIRPLIPETDPVFRIPLTR